MKSNYLFFLFYFLSFKIEYSMKKKTINLIVCLGILILTILSFCYSKELANNFYSSLIFIMKTILPSLFPFMIFINFILYSNCIDYLSYFLRPLSKIFNLSGYGLVCLIASLLGGFPYVAILVESFLKENKIDDDEAHRLLFCLSFPSISFMFGIIYNLDKNSLLNIISLYMASLILLLITSFKKQKCKKNNSIRQSTIRNDFVNVYYEVMNSSLKSILSISYTIIFFKMITFLLTKIIKNKTIFLLISGLLEFSSTSIEILNIQNKTFNHYLILNTILSFSSLSIIFQTLYYSKKIGFKLKKLLFSRITISLLANLIFIIFHLFFK